MHTEYEASFLNIDKEALRQTLTTLGARLVYPEYMMKRVVFDPPINIPGGWMQVRQEAESITMSLKVVDGKHIDDQKEVMVTIDDFEQGVLFLESIGATRKAYQETLRELWRFEEVGVDICIDTWPGLHPFVEIEGSNESVVQEIAGWLGFDYAKAVFGGVDEKYLQELGIPKHVVNAMPIITFEEPPQYVP